MAQYVYHPDRKYRDHLQAEAYLQDIRWEISSRALKVGASVDALKEQGIHIESAVAAGAAAVTEQGEATRAILGEGFDRVGEGLETLADVNAAGFVRLHMDLNEVNSSLHEMSAKFDYGLGQISSRLGAINDTLEELKRIAQNPEQTWAFEQYEIARDAYKRELYEEALQYVTRAIGGHQRV